MAAKKGKAPKYTLTRILQAVNAAQLTDIQREVFLGALKSRKAPIGRPPDPVKLAERRRREEEELDAELRDFADWLRGRPEKGEP